MYASGILVCDVHLWLLRDGKDNFPLYFECSKVFGNVVGRRVKEIASMAEYMFVEDEKSDTVLVRSESGPTILVDRKLDGSGTQMSMQLYPVLYLFRGGFIDAEFNERSFRLRRYS